MEYNVGDKVRILPKEERPAQVTFGWNVRMNQYENRIFEIREKEYTTRGPKYYFVNNNTGVNSWSWSSEMLAPAYEEPKEEDVFALFSL